MSKRKMVGIEDDVAGLVEAYREQQVRAHAGWKLTTTGAVRLLLLEALDQNGLGLPSNKPVRKPVSGETEAAHDQAAARRRIRGQGKRAKSVDERDERIRKMPRRSR